jgi:hypothetical protein
MTDSMIPRFQFAVGDYLHKHTGDTKWYGWVVARYFTRRGKERYVIEVDPQGFQMIGAPEQLEKTDEPR